MNQDIDNLIMTDAELVSLSLENQDYFGVLIEHYEQKLSRYIMRSTSVSREDRQDLLQNIFVKVYLHLNGFDRSLSFNAWIYRIAHNEIVDWSRREKTKIKYGKFDYEDDIFTWTADGQHFLNEIHAHEQSDAITQALAHMDEKYRQVLVLKFIEGHSYRDISDILKKPKGTIATLVSRAKKSFKQYYEKQL